MSKNNRGSANASKSAATSLGPLDCYLEDLCLHGLTTVVRREEEAKAVAEDIALKSAFQRAISRFGQPVTEETARKVREWVKGKRAEAEAQLEARRMQPLEPLHPYAHPHLYTHHMMPVAMGTPFQQQLSMQQSSPQVGMGLPPAAAGPASGGGLLPVAALPSFAPDGHSVSVSHPLAVGDLAVASRTPEAAVDNVVASSGTPAAEPLANETTVAGLPPASGEEAEAEGHLAKRAREVDEEKEEDREDVCVEENETQPMAGSAEVGPFDAPLASLAMVSAPAGPMTLTPTPPVQQLPMGLAMGDPVAMALPPQQPLPPHPHAHAYPHPPVMGYSQQFYPYAAPPAGYAYHPMGGQPIAYASMPPAPYGVPHHAYSMVHSAPVMSQAGLSPVEEVVRKRVRIEEDPIVQPVAPTSASLRDRTSSPEYHTLPYNWRSKEHALAVINELLLQVPSKAKYLPEIKASVSGIRTAVEYFSLYPEECTQVTEECSADTKAAAYELAHRIISFLCRCKFPYLSHQEVEKVVHDCLSDQRSKGYYGWQANGYVTAKQTACRQLAVIDETSYAKKKGNSGSSNNNASSSSKRDKKDKGSLRRKSSGGRYSDSDSYDSDSDRSRDRNSKKIRKVGSVNSSGSHRKDGGANGGGANNSTSNSSGRLGMAPPAASPVTPLGFKSYVRPAE